MNEDDLKQKLSDEEYRVLRKGGTEAPFSGEYVDTKEPGVYRCKVCGNVLFSSTSKVDSRESNPGLQGWPSFTDPAVAENIGTRPDDSLGMRRTEVYCKKCNSHLGHVFDETIENQDRKHYCINSVCLQFDEGDPKAL
jgi:peptide-methionine (R)-S-oxide reductase